MLRFNPNYRKSAAELVSSSIFDSVRDPSMEIEACKQIFLEIDEPGQFDYETNSDRLQVEGYQALMEDLFKSACI